VTAPRSGLAALALTLLVAAPLAAAARGVDEVIADVRAATARYLDIEAARADGFVQVSDMEPRHGYHFMNTNASILSATGQLWSSRLDLGRPPMLLYVRHGERWQLTGVEYALPARPADNPLPGARWHEHEASCHYRDYRELPAASAAACPPRHPETAAEFVLFHPAIAVVHVWAWYPNPDGPFAEENRYLAPYGGRASASGGHDHARSGTEMAYSELNHRSAGVVLLVLAAVMAWELRRPRPLPWGALSSVLWIALGVYLFIVSDPEAWPLGPGRFGDIFTDTEVLQHKVLTLLPIAIGVLEALRKAGWLHHRAWAYALPGVALFGGAYLFVHFHEGGFRLDGVWVQHALMGATGLALGVAALVGARRSWWGSGLRYAFPVLVAIMALVLLLYSEA
jgi:hypothetical protein